MKAIRWLISLALCLPILTLSADPVSDSLAILQAQSPNPVRPIPQPKSPPPALPPSPPVQKIAADPLEIFSAIAAEDATWLARLLAAKVDPNTTFPKPGPREFTKFYEGTDLHYYLRTEPGFTALMFAANIGNAPAVDALLAAGASKGRLTQRSKTSALYLAARAGHISIMRTLMGITADSPVLQYRIHVSLSDQRVVLWKGEKIILFSKISSGKESTPTETGTYLVTSKHKDHTSTLFDAEMPYFMRFSCGDFGLHAGDLPGYAASHGCIRMPLRDAREFYEATPIGTLVVVD